MKTVMVTGAAGFIGSNFVRYLLETTDHHVINLDKLTYAGNLKNLEDIANNERYQFVQADISDSLQVQAAFEKFKPLWIVNLAAESHVDRSIDGPENFINTNFVGVFVLLEIARKYFATLSLDQKKAFRFLQVSTDEVYGSLGPVGSFQEETPYAPNSPYSASKAGADHLVRAYFHTYALPILITNCSNNYGPYQFPEKLIPLTILNALEEKELPIYGNGLNVRDWLYVEDHCSGIYAVLLKGKLGEKYNIGGSTEKTNIEIVDALCHVLNQKKPSDKVQDYKSLKKFVQDRPGHDKRYAIDSSKIQRELGWKPVYDFETGIARTVEWYLNHQDWCQSVQSGNYQRERLGLNKS